MSKGRKGKNKVDLPWKNFIFCPVEVEQAQFQKQLDDVQSIIVEMILLGRSIRIKEEREVSYEEVA